MTNLRYSDNGRDQNVGVIQVLQLFKCFSNLTSWKIKNPYIYEIILTELHYYIIFYMHLLLLQDFFHPVTFIQPKILFPQEVTRAVCLVNFPNLFTKQRYSLCLLEKTFSSDKLYSKLYFGKLLFTQHINVQLLFSLIISTVSWEKTLLGSC